MRRFGGLLNDNIINNLRQRRYETNYAKKTYIKKIEEMNKYKRSLAKFKKIYRLQDDYEPDNLADKKIKDVVDTFKRSRTTKTTNRDTYKVDVSRLENNTPMNINIFNNNIINRSRHDEEILASNRQLPRGLTKEKEDSYFEENESMENPHKKKLVTLVSKLNTRSPRRAIPDGILSNREASHRGGNTKSVQFKDDINVYDDINDVIISNSERSALGLSKHPRSNSNAEHAPLSKFINSQPLNITDNLDYD
jgi:hypothetical protein